MENNKTSKERIKKIKVFKIIPGLTFLVLIATLPALGQDSLKYWKLNTENDHFWELNCPTPSSLMDGYTLWLLRQKMTLDIYQTILSSEINLDKGKINKIQFTNNLPFIAKGNFHSTIGTQYDKSDIQSDNDSLNKSLQEVWLWLAMQYKYKKWNFTLTSETCIRGDESTLYDKTGNESFALLYIGYEINPSWDLILLSGYTKQQLFGKVTEKPLYGFQARYQPSSKLKLMFGAPTIFATEWTALNKTDIGMDFMYTTESFFYIRQRMTNNVSISVQYNSSLNNSTATYFNNSIYKPGNNSTIIFNKVSNLQPKLFTELNFKLLQDIGFCIGAGYIFSSKMSLFNNNEKVYDGLKSKDNFFVYFSMQFLRFK
jgi:hypothetical protein